MVNLEAHKSCATFSWASFEGRKSKKFYFCGPS
uniref:Uncharacterized protein n=1 Tax=Rhizophora mucronata TaxID=61149 RepID=A0A2P2PV89_RHIMU